MRSRNRRFSEDRQYYVRRRLSVSGATEAIQSLYDDLTYVLRLEVDDDRPSGSFPVLLLV